MSEPEHVGLIVSRVMQTLTLCAYLRDLEARITENFDKELSAKIDCIRFLLGE